MKLHCFVLAGLWTIAATASAGSHRRYLRPGNHAPTHTSLIKSSLQQIGRKLSSEAYSEMELLLSDIEALKKDTARAVEEKLGNLKTSASSVVDYLNQLTSFDTGRATDKETTIGWIDATLEALDDTVQKTKDETVKDLIEFSKDIDIDGLKDTLEKLFELESKDRPLQEKILTAEAMLDQIEQLDENIEPIAKSFIELMELVEEMLKAGEKRLEYDILIEEAAKDVNVSLLDEDAHGAKELCGILISVKKEIIDGARRASFFNMETEITARNEIHQLLLQGDIQQADAASSKFTDMMERVKKTEDDLIAFVERKLAEVKVTLKVLSDIDDKNETFKMNLDVAKDMIHDIEDLPKFDPPKALEVASETPFSELASDNIERVLEEFLSTPQVALEDIDVEQLSPTEVMEMISELEADLKSAKTVLNERISQGVATLQREEDSIMDYVNKLPEIHTRSLADKETAIEWTKKASDDIELRKEKFEAIKNELLDYIENMYEGFKKRFEELSKSDDVDSEAFDKIIPLLDEYKLLAESVKTIVESFYKAADEWKEPLKMFGKRQEYGIEMEAMIIDDIQAGEEASLLFQADTLVTTNHTLSFEEVQIMLVSAKLKINEIFEKENQEVEEEREEAWDEVLDEIPKLMPTESDIEWTEEEWEDIGDIKEKADGIIKDMTDSLDEELIHIKERAEELIRTKGALLREEKSVTRALLNELKLMERRAREIARNSIGDIRGAGNMNRKWTKRLRGELVIEEIFEGKLNLVDALLMQQETEDRTVEPDRSSEEDNQIFRLIENILFGA